MTEIYMSTLKSFFLLKIKRDISDFLGGMLIRDILMGVRLFTRKEEISSPSLLRGVQLFKRSDVNFISPCHGVYDFSREMSSTPSPLLSRRKSVTS